jgi:hypothetical protein
MSYVQLQLRVCAEPVAVGAQPKLRPVKAVPVEDDSDVGTLDNCRDTDTCLGAVTQGGGGRI